MAKTCQCQGFRQGELLFIPVKLKDRKNGENAGMDLKTNVIREGELTGHKHEIEGRAIVRNLTNTFIGGGDNSLPNGQMVMDANTDVVIKHPEHKDLKLKKGFYVIRFQREFDEHSNRFVSD